MLTPYVFTKHMTFIQPSKCEICKNLKGYESANLLLQEDLPGAAYQLDGIKDPPSSSCTYYIKCPICETHYEYHCDAHCMEYDIYISIVPPYSALKEKLIDKKRYNEIITNLPSELDSKQDDKAEYAARALADHYLEEGNTKKVMELLKHKNPTVRIQTCYGVGVAAKEKTADPTPYVDTLAELLFDKNPFVADSADFIYDTYSVKKSENIVRFWENLMKAFSKHDMTYHSITILNKAVHDGTHLTHDISPCVKNLIKFFTKKTKYDYLYKDASEVLDAYVKVGKKNAKRFLKELAKFKGRRFFSSLDEIEKNARIT